MTNQIHQEPILGRWRELRDHLKALDVEHFDMGAWYRLPDVRCDRTRHLAHGRPERVRHHLLHRRLGRGAEFRRNRQDGLVKLPPANFVMDQAAKLLGIGNIDDAHALFHGFWNPKGYFGDTNDITLAEAVAFLDELVAKAEAGPFDLPALILGSRTTLDPDGDYDGDSWMPLDPRDVCPCDRCGRPTHIDLLDAKDDGTPRTMAT